MTHEPSETNGFSEGIAGTPSALGVVASSGAAVAGGGAAATGGGVSAAGEGAAATVALKGLGGEGVKNTLGAATPPARRGEDGVKSTGWGMNKSNRPARFGVLEGPGVNEMDGRASTGPVRAAGVAV